MFYEGDIQGGIAQALQESKSVVCFVKDGSEESDRWENEWLTDQNIPAALSRHAITLRIESGSQEAGHLSAVCPINQAPSLILIYQGTVTEQIVPGASKNDFTLRLLHALNRKTPRKQPSSSTPQTSSSSSSSSTSAHGTPGASVYNPSSPPRTHANPPPRPSQNNSQPPATDNPAQPHQEARGKQKDYVQQRLKAKQEADSERHRIRALVEADKLERQRRQSEQREQRLHASASAAAANAEAEEASQQRAADLERRTHRAGCALQVRLLDGSTIRQRFEAEDTLKDAVRGWIDQNTSVPYTLKLVLTPQPSRKLTDEDEGRQLKELGLVPSATLVLVGANNFSQAYRASGGRGVVRGGPALVWDYFMGSLMWLVGMIKYFLGIGYGADSSPRGNSEREAESDGTEKQKTSADASSIPAVDGSSAASSGAAGHNAPGAKRRIRTLRDQQGDLDDPQLYNGNQLNFEPNRKDDNNEKDK